MRNGRHLARSGNKRAMEHSKKLTNDIRALLWAVTLGGLLLAFYCVHLGYTGALPWVGAMVGSGGLVVGTKTKYVKGEFMVDKAKEAYQKTVLAELDREIRRVMK